MSGMVDMKACNVKKAAWGFVLAAATLLAVAPAAVFADTPPSVTLGEPSLNGATCTFPNAKVTGGVNTLTVSLTGAGKINSKTTPDMQDTTGTSMTFTFNVDSQADATGILAALSFSDCKSTTKIEVTADANQTTELPTGATLSKLGDHYYMYVPEKLSWSKAYNKAKTYKYNGAQGYLATITSDDEYEAIHERAGSASGWVGGTLMLKSDYSKIDDDAALTQSAGAFVYKEDAAYDNTKATAIKDYYWACGPEAGESITVDTHSNSEPNAFKHTGSDQPWSGMDNTLDMTTYECCLTANNEGRWTINDITESGYKDSGYADGFFVEFGGYAEGKDPGAPDASLTSNVSYSLAQNHACALTYTADANVLTAKCENSSDPLCPLSSAGLTLTLSTGSKTYDGNAVEVVGTTDERKAWKTAGLTIPTATLEYSDTEDGTYAATDKVRNAGYYKASLSACDVTATSTYYIAKQWCIVEGLTVKDKVYDGTTTAELDKTKTVIYGYSTHSYIDNDLLNITATCSFGDADAEMHKRAAVSDAALSGPEAANYQLIRDCSYMDVYASITQREVELNWGKIELEYTGEEQIPTCSLGNIVNDDEVEVVIEGAQTAVGENYTATATTLDDGNYKLPENPSVSFSIVKASIAPSVTIDGWTYGDEANEPVVADATNPGKGAVTYEYSKKGEDAWSATVPTDAGEYAVRATVAETDNYKSGIATAGFTIAPKNIKGARVVLGAGLTANGSEQEQTVESVVLPDGTKLAATDYALSGNKATTAGGYKLTVTGTGDYAGAVEVAFTVAVNPDETAANEAIDKINAIGKVDDSEASREVIEVARRAYDALTDEQKKLVDPAVLKKLEQAEAAYKQARAEAEKKAAEQQKPGSKTETKTTVKTTVKNNGLAVTGDLTPFIAGALVALGLAAAAAGIVAKRRSKQ